MTEKVEMSCDQCKPHRCPVCGGTGSVKSTTRSAGLTGSYQTNETVICGACHGARIVWPPCVEFQRMQLELKS